MCDVAHASLTFLMVTTDGEPLVSLICPVIFIRLIPRYVRLPQVMVHPFVPKVHLALQAQLFKLGL